MAKAFRTLLLFALGMGAQGMSACGQPPTDQPWAGGLGESDGVPTGGGSFATGGSSSASGGGNSAAGESSEASGGGNSAAGGSSEASGGGNAAAGGSSGASGGGNSAAGGSAIGAPLGAYPFEPSPSTQGGTMTFTNIGAPGAWPRRLDREPGDPSCDYKDGEDTWGGHCCQTLHQTASDRLAPFDEEMTLILKAIEIKQLAIYQPERPAALSESAWRRVTAWDERGTSENLWFTQSGEGSASFPGDLTSNDCVGYLMQKPSVVCEDGAEYCPNDPGVLHRGFSGSKLVVFLGSMDVDDSKLTSCGSGEPGHPGPWVAFVASELVRDGGRKWNGLCNCYSQTGSVGDGCGEINVFEVVLDGNQYSNREFASTGVRSYQEGHIGGAVCGEDCERNAFLPTDVEVVDACGGMGYASGPEIVAGGATDGCPVWRRPQGDRFFFILLDELSRRIVVGIMHPSNLPKSLAGMFPELPGVIDRAVVDAIADLRLPN